MPCSCCGLPGHTYVKCPSLSPEQIAEKKAEAAKVKEEKKNRKIKKERHTEMYAQRDYVFRNNNMYEVVLYWGYSEIPENELRHREKLIRMIYIPAMEQIVVKLCKIYRVVVLPVLEVVQDNNSAMKVLPLDVRYVDYFKLIDVELDKYPDTIFEFSREYHPPKSELEQWKEFGLKSHYLLKEMEKFTSTNKRGEDGEMIFHEKYDNIEPFLSIIQDIPIPANCSEADKEKAGIPSALTNIT
jgi:hypothetical protein